MENEKNYITLNISDGTEMAAYTAFPENRNDKSAAIMVWQEAFGVNHHMRKVTERFAREGYIAICPELFHRTAPRGFEGDYTDFNTVAPHTKALTVPGLEADIQATYQWLTAQDNVDKERIYCVGYCMGGRVSYIANTMLSLRAAASYYGSGIDALTDRAINMHGKHLFYWGGLDKHITSESIHTILKAVEAAGKDFVNVKISYADHGFNCDERASYNEEASRESWALTLAFMSEA